MSLLRRWQHERASNPIQRSDGADMTKSRNILPPRKVWTDAEIAILTARYPNERAQVLADEIGCNVCIIYAKAKKLGLKKSDAFNSGIESGRLDGVTGVDTRFQKGHVPWTKGTHFVAGGRSAPR